MAIDRTFFRGVEYEKKFTREYLVQRSDAPVTGVLRCAIPLRHLIILPTGKQYQADYIFPVKEWEAYEKYIARRFARRGGLRKMNEQYSNGRDRLRAALRGMVRARSRGLAAMQPFFKRYLDVTLSSYSEIYIQPWGYDAQFVPYVKERLTAAVDTDVMEQIWEAISLPRKIYAAQDAERAVYACYLRGTLKQAVFRITKKYCWLSVYNLNHEPVTPEYFLQFVKGKTKKQVAKEYARLSNLAQDNTRRVRAAFSNVRDRHFRSLLYDMNAYAFARTERIDTLKQSYYALTFFFEALRTQLSVVRRKDASFLDVVSFTTPEIIAFLEKRKIPDASALHKRADVAYAYYYDHRGFSLLENKQELRKLRKYLSSETTATEIRGQIAFGGNVRGVVRLVTSMADAKKLNAGEILVSTMTFPEYIHAMKKAAAFVTNEGGITCHAAIVAREMKKPCIIGTKIATKVLRNEDVVEVDAEKGIVKVIDHVK